MYYVYRLEDHLVFWSLHGTLFALGSLFVAAFVCAQVPACHWMFLALPPTSALQYWDFRDSLPHLIFLLTFWRAKARSSHLTGTVLYLLSHRLDPDCF